MAKACIFTSRGNSALRRLAISCVRPQLLEPGCHLEAEGGIGKLGWFGTLCRPAGTSCAGQFASPSRPPFAFPFLVTVEGDLQKPREMSLKASPLEIPTRISSRSPMVRLPGLGDQVTGIGPLRCPLRKTSFPAFIHPSCLPISRKRMPWLLS